MNNAFTYEQAQEIAEDFEDLEGTEYLKDGMKYEIDKVELKPAGNNEYTVQIVAFALPERTLHIIDIMDYVNDNGVGYNFPS